MNWLDQLYNIRDALQVLWDNPGAVLAALETNHILLMEVIAVLVILLFLIYILLKPSKKKKGLAQAGKSPTVQKANSRVEVKELPKEPKLELPVQKEKDAVSKTVKAAQEEARQRQLQKQQEEAELKKKAEAALQDLSMDEELALTEAIQSAGKQALAEVSGAPHQVEFFEEESAARDAAKKMFSKTKAEAEADSAILPLKKAPATPRLDFLMIYFMAPRSQTYKVFNLFKMFEEFNLFFNEDNVFEYSDQQGLQFYIASAIKPGVFDLGRQGDVPGLSFIIDLQKVNDGRGAFNKMLIFIDALSKQLKGDILDERRQRLTTATMSEYLARIKSFNNTYK